MVILLSRHSVNAEGVNVVVCEIPKNRQGRVGELALSFDGRYQRWQECAMPLQTKTMGARRPLTNEV